MAFSAAFSMIMIITGVARTGGNIASLNRLARCSGVTTSWNKPLAPDGIVFKFFLRLELHVIPADLRGSASVRRLPDEGEYPSQYLASMRRRMMAVAFTISHDRRRDSLECARPRVSHPGTCSMTNPYSG